jgi:hypothetical protein
LDAHARTAEGWRILMKKENFKPGQTVYLLSVRFMGFDYLRIEKRIIETTVEAVGRKYITVKYAKTKFDINNDFREVTNYSIDYKLFLSKEDIKEDFKRRKMEDQIYNAFHFPNHVTRKMTFDELETVHNIVKKYMKF